MLQPSFTAASKAAATLRNGVPYRNVGIHGAGSANAADALAAIRLTYEEEGTNGLKKLLEAKRRNFEGSEELRRKLHDDMPKVGNADAAVDSELRFLFDCFADAADKFSDSKRKIRPGQRFRHVLHLAGQ